MGIQLRPGDYIVIHDAEKETPATVEQLRWQHTRNGEAAIAVVLEFEEIISARTLTAEIEIAGLADDGVGVIGSDNDYRVFLFSGVDMATPDQIAFIQSKLAQQREMMKAAIVAQVHDPGVGGGGGRVSESTKVRQRERAKEKRADERETLEAVLELIMGEMNCTREEARDELKRRAGR